MDADKKDISQYTSFQIIVVGKDVDIVERYCKNIHRTGTNTNVNISGVMRLPVKRLKITTRKSPCGEGTNSWDRYEMRIYKRVFNIKDTTVESISEIVNNVPNPSGVQVTVAVSN